MFPLAVIAFPNIDPVAFSIGPLDVRWYSLGYIVGLLFAIWYGKRLTRNTALWGDNLKTKPEHVDDFLIWATIGIIVGGRIGYVLFYKPSILTGNPLEIFQVWNGGMSFHGGFLGTIVAGYLFTRRNKIPFWQMFDLAAATVPVALFLVRIANFIKGELFGRPTDVPWAMVFPWGGPQPRHPSQLYEAALEGIILFTIIQIAIYRFKVLKRTGFASGLFCIGYGTSRIIVEFFREPDAHIGYIANWFTLGMIYSLPMIFAGFWLLYNAKRQA